MKAIAIFGGTFDPVHIAHLRLAYEAMQSFGFEQVRWIPSGDPGHRAAPLVSARHRLNMLRLAVQDEPRFVVDASEVERGEPTYTVPMLKRLRAELARDQPVIWISGADSFLSMPSWLAWREVFELVHVVIGERPGYPIDLRAMAPELASEYRSRIGHTLDAPAGAVASFTMTLLDVSASKLREDLHSGRLPRYLLSERVLEYIEANRLYI